MAKRPQALDIFLKVKFKFKKKSCNSNIYIIVLSLFWIQLLVLKQKSGPQKFIRFVQWLLKQYSYVDKFR